jgi:cytochrome c-type protein NapC
MDLSGRKKLIWILGIVFLGVPIVVTASWLVTQSMIEATSDVEFCGGCHSMKPIAAAYREDVHGGNNWYGVQVKCSECHLPHDNNLVYFVMKGYTGIKDVVAELTYAGSINWEARRDERENYVFDSGCLRCHSNLANAQLNHELGVLAHQKYFAGKIERQCVSCHINVGHKNLSEHLNAAQSGS